MIIELDMSSDTPIYVQLRNQIVKGIGKGEIQPGEKLPTVRQLAADAGVNTMTVNKTFVSENINMDAEFRDKLESELELLSAEASITGMNRDDFLKLCDEVYSKMKSSPIQIST